MFNVTAEIGAVSGELTPTEFVVGGRSFYTLIPPDMAQRLGLELPVTTTLATADNNYIQVPLGLGRIRLMGREQLVELGVMDVPMPRLGKMALQALGLKADPVNKRLEYDRPYAEIPVLAAAGSGSLRRVSDGIR